MKNVNKVLAFAVVMLVSSSVFASDVVVPTAAPVAASTGICSKVTSAVSGAAVSAKDAVVNGTTSAYNWVVANPVAWVQNNPYKSVGIVAATAAAVAYYVYVYKAEDKKDACRVACNS